MDKVLVLDFGGQYDQLIARRVREMSVYAEIRAYNKISPEQIIEEGYKAVILTGGPNSVYLDESPHYDRKLIEIGIPVLGICYGAQLITWMAGGSVSDAGSSGEYGKTEVTVDKTDSEADILLEGIPKDSICWMSHMDYISGLPEGFMKLAHTEVCPAAAIGDPQRKIFGTQFHPEVTHTVYGKQIMANFLFKIAGIKADWKMDDFIETSLKYLQERLKGKKVLLALSGGVDSSVCAALLSRAIGDDLAAVFVDHGLLRKNEGDLVEAAFRNRFDMNFIRIDAEDRFLTKLSGVIDPEIRRKIIGEEFIRTFEDISEEIGDINVLAQGTIYPDVIESGKGDSSVIKSHHNVGGLPSVMRFDEIIEPLRDLFKDEVREVGLKLGLPKELIMRQPFPGPGLGVRVIGEITKEKLDILRDADAIFREEIAKAGLEAVASQYFAVLTDVRSVGVKGDARTYGYTVVLRSVTTDDFMTAEWTRLPYEVLERTSLRITNEIEEITRVVYDITSKPPATVEWL